MRKKLPMVLIRVIVGLIFLIEGILKFVRPGELGVGRFVHIGLPIPQVLAPFVGGVEIAAGAALILNLYTGEAAVLLLVVITTALLTTKIPILMGRHLGPFASVENGALRLIELPARSAHRFGYAVWPRGYSARQRYEVWAKRPLNFA